MEFICNGTRNSKWYYDDGEYVRVFDKRTGKSTKKYSIEQINGFDPESDNSFRALQDDANKRLTA